MKLVFDVSGRHFTINVLMRKMDQQTSDQFVLPCRWDDSAECFDILEIPGETSHMITDDMIEQCIYYDRRAMNCLFKQDGKIYYIDSFLKERIMYRLMCEGMSARDAFAVAEL